MGKYDPLEGHLRRQTAPVYYMCFRDIERLLACLLPRRAQRAEWWTNGHATGERPVQAHAWLNAGYHAVLLEDERVRFERIAV